MHLLMVALLAAAAWSDAGVVEPNEDAMRTAFAADLSDGVRSALAFSEETGGAQALERIRAARTDAFAIRDFRKGECRLNAGRSGHVCDFAVEIDTVAGPISRAIVGRFFVGPCGLVYDQQES